MSRDQADDDPMSPDSQLSSNSESSNTANPSVQQGRGTPLRPSAQLDANVAITAAANAEPLTREWNVPARPKPGRKPAQDTPVDKRRAQNRAAQRNFRERRNARVGELEIELADIRKSYESTIASLKLQHTKEKDALQQEIFMWRARCEEHERQRNIEQEKARKALEQSQYRWQGGSSPVTTPGSAYFGSSYPNDHPFSSHSNKIPPLLPPPKVSKEALRSSYPNQQVLLTTPQDQDIKPLKDIRPLSPPEDNDPMEVDFTTQKTAPLSTMLREDDIREIPEVDNCGFCSDNTPCICRDEMIAAQTAAREQEAARRRSSATADASAAVTFSKRPMPIEPSPGTCSDCMADPLRKQFCINLSAYSSSRPKVSSIQRPISSNPRNAPPPSQAPAFQRISCADAYSRLRTEIPQFEKHVNDQNLYRQLRPSPAAPDSHRSVDAMDGVEREASAAYELDAANVLATIASSKGGSYQGKQT